MYSSYLLVVRKIKNAQKKSHIKAAAQLKNIIIEMRCYMPAPPNFGQRQEVIFCFLKQKIEPLSDPRPNWPQTSARNVQKNLKHLEGQLFTV